MRLRDDLLATQNAGLCNSSAGLQLRTILINEV